MNRLGRRVGALLVFILLAIAMSIAGVALADSSPITVLTASQTRAHTTVADAAADDEGASDDTAAAEDVATDDTAAEDDTDDEVALSLFYVSSTDSSKTVSCSNKKNPPRIYEPSGSLQLAVKALLPSGKQGWVDSLGIGVVWSIEAAYDEDGSKLKDSTSLATINRGDGELRALGQGNGSVTVRCTISSPASYSGYAETTVTIEGNSGVPYVSDLQICDEDGKVYKDDAEIRVDSADFGYEKKFYAKVTYIDPVTEEKTVVNTHDGDTVNGLTWSVSGDSKSAYVNEDTGVFIAQDTGTVKLSAYISGAGLLGDTISDSVVVLCGGDTLESRDYTPADYLTVVIKYAAEDKSTYLTREDYEVTRTWYYTTENLAELGTTTNSYSLIKNDGNWSRMDAYGIYLADLIGDQNLDLDDIEGFYFGATDDYNPGFVGCSWLFDTNRYYYPNLSMGSGTLDARQVAPMLAFATYEETLGDGLVNIDAESLSEQTRYRLCLGAESTTVNNARQSIYNVHTITIILEGAPPTGWGDPNNGSGTKPGSGSGDSGGSGTVDQGSASGDDTGNDSGDTGSDTPASDDNDNSGAVAGSDDTTPSDTGSQSQDAQSAEEQPSEQESSEQTQENQSASEQEASATSESQAGSSSSAADAAEDAEDTSTEDTATQEESGQTVWQAYEIMNPNDSSVEALDVDNPYLPYALAAVLLAFVLGGLLTYRRYRNDLAAGAATAVAAG